MHNYLDGIYQITCDWNCHIARGSAGGTDYGMTVGTPIHASFDGQLTNRPPVKYPAGGNVAILTRNDGIAFYHLHLSEFVTPGPVNQGDIIGYSGGAVGAPGSGSSTGPHLHVNAYQGNIIHDVHDYYTTTAETNGTPITSTQRKVARMNPYIYKGSGGVIYIPVETANGTLAIKQLTQDQYNVLVANGAVTLQVTDTYLQEFRGI